MGLERQETLCTALLPRDDVQSLGVGLGLCKGAGCVLGRMIWEEQPSMCCLFVYVV